MRLAKHSSALISAALLAGGMTTLAQSQPGYLPATVIRPPSSQHAPAGPNPRSHTQLLHLATPLRSAAIATAAGSPPFSGYFYETPGSIACIYGLTPHSAGCNPNNPLANPAGGSNAVAIVDAFDNPTIFYDAQIFSTQFGLPAINSGNFVVVYAPPGADAPGSCQFLSNPPAPPWQAGNGWDLEEALDAEWVHAMAPQATIYVVESQSDYTADLLCAVSVASKLVSAAGGGSVSMSWGGDESSDELGQDAVFTHPKVVYFAAAGDNPGAESPSTSPNVVSVGGSSISRNFVTGAFLRETPWQDAGTGPSLYEHRPAYQASIAALVGNHRATPDVSATANPNSGVWVIDESYSLADPNCGAAPCWYIVGGTSVATPLWAGIVNAAGSFAPSSFAQLKKLYGDTWLSTFNPVTIGSCGIYLQTIVTGSQTGWNYCAGLGSPRTLSGK